MSSDPGAGGQQFAAIVEFRLVTSDLSRLRRFYAETLGFAPDGPDLAIDAAELRLLGLQGTGRRQRMRLGEQCLAIDQFTEQGQPYPPGGDAASLWFQHFALVVTDMAQAYQRVRGAAAISRNGPQCLPPAAGAVHAFKFRDPDGHPLELLQFPAGSAPASWRSRQPVFGQIGLGIDHSAISVADADESATFYMALGLKTGERSFNHGPEQQLLDGLAGVEVAVVPMQPATGTPHLELLGYEVPRGSAGPALRANDVAATRIVWRGAQAALLRDPDGHLHQIVSIAQAPCP
jgi:catechol 2,3-dioxygenase-like lactoylglutathione lyase family enzyme